MERNSWLDAQNGKSSASVALDKWSFLFADHVISPICMRNKTTNDALVVELNYAELYIVL